MILNLYIALLHKENRKVLVYNLLLLSGFSATFTLSLAAMRNCIQQGAATDGAHNYRPGTHLNSSVERGKILC